MITSVAVLSQSTYSVVLKAMQGMVITSVAVDHLSIREVGGRGSVGHSYN